MSSGLSRRQVLRLISFLSAGTAAVASVPFIDKFFANKASAQTGVPVRKNIATFTPEEIESLRRGIRVMQSRPDTDPTSWIYQANMHGIPRNDSRRLTAWNTCDHGGFFFFPWHRMYLYYFERILRQASGDPNLTLPYWNYSDFLDQRLLPAPFRIPADPATNPLYVEERAPGINSGTIALAAAEVSYEAAFRRTNFFHTTSGGQSFGGRRVGNTTHRGSGGGALEGRPHNQVHVVVGGSNGWMRQVELAARDPIFWLHHANIDRLWERWLRLEGGRANPVGNSDWMNDPFTFFDENGRQVTLRGRDVINPVEQLNYTYDDDPSLVGNEVQLRRSDSAQATQRTDANTQPIAATSTDNQTMLIELRETPVTLTLPFTQTQGWRLLTNRSLEQGSFILNVERIEYNPSNSIPYQIYINLPQGVTPDPNSPYYAGRLALFALPQRGTFRLDISDVTRELQRLNLMTGDAMSVTFVPPSEEITELQRTNRSRQSSPGTVRFEQVTITTE